MSNNKLKDRMDEYSFQEWNMNFDLSSKSNMYSVFKNKSKFE